MLLRAGDRLGAYEIADLLGEGGMGTVYRAVDPRLGREVAIKIVRQAFAGDAERDARFEREARLLASLNHPHVATVHGLEQAGDTTFLVLELVPGETLAERLRDGPLPIREALTLASQIAGGIEAAHDRNIIHRDLKPANIKITPAGTVKVLDFGLAKALALDSGTALRGQTKTQPAGTADGLILGTAAYMSPEQARGKDVDKRTDIWAFGCVLYDMLTGKPAFSGDTVSDTLAAILTCDPDWSLLPPRVPASIVHLLRRCLEKDVNRRLRDVGDARLEIEEALASTGDSHAALASGDVAPGAAQPATRARITPLTIGALIIGVLLGATGVSLLRPAAALPERAQVQFALSLPDGDRLAGLDFQMIAMSPAETYVAYVASRRGHQQLFVRALSSPDAQPLDGTEGAINPFFSPDGQWIAFFAGGKLKKVPVSGGAVRDIADAEIGFGGAWAPDGTIVFASNNASPLSRVSSDGGTPQPITTLDTSRGEFSHRWPALLPDGTTVAYAIGTVGDWDDAEIAVQPLTGGARRIVLQGGTYPRFLPGGQLVYAHAGVIHAVALDPRSYELRGKGAPVLSGVQQSVDGAAQIAIAQSGGIVYVPGAGHTGRTLVWVDREGNAQPLAAAPAEFSSPRLSPDGRTLAVAITGSPDQIWTYSIVDNRLAQLTFDGGTSPVWSRDGQRIYFSAARGGPADIFVKAADGDTAEQRLARTDRADVPHSTSPDDRSLLVVQFDPAAGRDIALLGADGVSHPIVATPANEGAPAFSPDGRVFAYVSDDTGRAEVFVAPIDRPSQRVQVSSGGGTQPVWRRDGTELFFRTGTRLVVVAVKTHPALAAGPGRVLFEGTFETGSAGSPAYDVSADGMRLLMLKPAAARDDQDQLRVVLGWTQTVR